MMFGRLGAGFGRLGHVGGSGHATIPAGALLFNGAPITINGQILTLGV